MIPSAQQDAILDAFAEGSDLIIPAVAGAGKTTSAVMMADSQPDLYVLYLAYNRAIADEAKNRFGDMVTVRTAHGLAHRWATKAIPALMDKMGRKADYDHVVAGRLYPRDKAVTLKIVTEKSPRNVGPLMMSRMAIATVNNYLSSDDDDLGEQHFHRPENFSAAVWKSHARAMLLEHVVSGAERALADLFKPSGTITRFTHNAYLKLFALDEASDALAEQYDCIMIDEAQDMTPVISGIVLRQQGRTQIVAVGDPYQQIMGWAGARNAIPNLVKVSPDAAVLALSESYRFGPEVAERANRITACLSDPAGGFPAPVVLVGKGGPTEVVLLPPRSPFGEAPALTLGGPAKDPETLARFNVDAVLTRTNAGAIVEALEAVSAGFQPDLKADTKALHSFFAAAVKLQDGKKVTHPAMEGFSSWAEFTSFVEANTEVKNEYGMLVNLVSKYGAANLESLLNKVENHRGTGHRVLISTAHRSKGLEYPRVRLSEDFADFPEDEELMLLYVAITRAQKLLMPGPMWPLTEHGVAMSEGAIMLARFGCRLDGREDDARVLGDAMAAELRRAGKKIEGDLPMRLQQAATTHLARKPVTQDEQDRAALLRLVPAPDFSLDPLGGLESAPLLSAVPVMSAHSATAPVVSPSPQSSAPVQRRLGPDDVELIDGTKVMRWKRYQHHRLYVSDAADERLGWGDVKTGEVTTASAMSVQDMRALLEQHKDWAQWVESSGAILSVVR